MGEKDFLEEIGNEFPEEKRTVISYFKTWYSGDNHYEKRDSEGRIALPEYCIDSRITENSDYYGGLEKHFGVEEYKKLFNTDYFSKEDIVVVGEGYIHPVKTPTLVPVIYLTKGYYPVNEGLLVEEGWRDVPDWDRYSHKIEELLDGVSWWIERK